MTVRPLLTRLSILPLVHALGAAPAFAETAEHDSLVADSPGTHSTYVFDPDNGLHVVCAPLLVCDTALETGEVISDSATGDSKDWFVQSFTSGPRETPHVVLKPQGYDFATNLIVATNRRTYHFHLVSPSEAVAHTKGFHYDRLVSFTYPGATLQHVAAAEELRPTPSPAPAAEPGRCADPTCWSYRCRVSTGRFAPLRVLDDGAHVYIQLSSREAPALFEVLPDKTTAPLPYRYSPTRAGSSSTASSPPPAWSSASATARPRPPSSASRQGERRPDEPLRRFDLSGPGRAPTGSRSGKARAPPITRGNSRILYVAAIFGLLVIWVITFTVTSGHGPAKPPAPPPVQEASPNLYSLASLAERLRGDAQEDRRGRRRPSAGAV